MWSNEVLNVDYVMDADAQIRLANYFGRIGEVLGNKKRRASFATYAMGLLGEAERKSMEPIAARACVAPAEVDALHQRLGHFLADSPWSDRAVRRVAAEFGMAAMIAHHPVETWIVDDTGFLKQGTHSVGVQRQYTGSAGKVTNCQIGVSLSVATRADHLPIDFELYLPRCWTEDAERRIEARIPDSVTFKTKPELAMTMIDRALEDGVPPGVVLADEAYGTVTEFREGLRRRGLEYAVAINSNTSFWSVSRTGKLIGRVPWTAKELAMLLGPKRFRRTTWRNGTGGARLSARFAMRRVVPAHDTGEPLVEREHLWLLMEWRDDEPEPAHFYLVRTNHDPTRKQLVRMVKERYRTERAYEDLKGELGLDHFEGRRFTGWNHHVSVALACYAFITAERACAFPPSARGQDRNRAHRREAAAPLRGFIHHRAARHRARAHLLAPEVSALSEKVFPPCIHLASSEKMTQ
jgi:SRSO17 transposase